MRPETDIGLAFIAMEHLDLVIAKFKTMSKTEQVVTASALVKDITQGCGIYATLPYEARIALSFYVMGYSKALK